MVSNKAVVLTTGLVAILVACAGSKIRSIPVSHELPKDLPRDLQERFEVREVASVPAVVAGPQVIPPDSLQASNRKGKSSKKKSKKKSQGKQNPDQLTTREKEGGVPLASQETQSSFVYPNRRGAVDPIWIGEKFTFSITYFGVSAGDFSLEALPFKLIGNRQVYHLKGAAVSSAVFSLFYRLNDVVESFLDYEGLFSHRFHILLDETKQQRDSLELYDSEKKQTYYWNRWHHKVNGYTESKDFFPIEPFSQDSMSALYYLRTIPLPTGAVITFPVVSEGKGWEAVCTVVRRESRDSPLGTVKTIVIKPEMKYQGILKKSGDSFLWLTDDDRRIPIRLEAKVRIGTVVASVKKIELGTQPSLKTQVATPLLMPHL